MYYTKEHEWVKIVGEVAEIGISDYAQKSLGEVVFVELPDEGDSFIEGDVISDIESVKAASPVYCPISGTVIEINKSLVDHPELLNSDPLSTWICKLKDIKINKENLLTEQEYQDYIKSF